MSTRAYPFLMLLCATLVLGLSACGFHLREHADLPAQMQDLYIQPKGDRDFRRHLQRALQASGVTVHTSPGKGIARMKFSEARFTHDSLSVSGQGRVNEYAVRFHVTFMVEDDEGQVIVPEDSIVLTRDFTYDDKDSAGRSSQVEVLEKSMLDDMVRNIMFKLQANAS